MWNSAQNLRFMTVFRHNMRTKQNIALVIQRLTYSLAVLLFITQNRPLKVPKPVEVLSYAKHRSENVRLPSVMHVFLKARQAAPRPLSGTATPPQVCFTFLFALGTCLNGHDVCFRYLCSNINHRCSNTYNQVISYELCNYFGEFLSI